ncbi:hypothetical protein A9G28_00190 [Gilliamella sp. Fer1-1]|uniref:hypothetical protein n=1 Tax=Gilliamella sp. Fer1-1 TaxID=3120240 RepID=UPI00080E4A68|nr:hypothetical protein [Gilliamella apicola]OCG44405.1 hypothetical protein A9G28_00190 [Gilliamella apicola]
MKMNIEEERFKYQTDYLKKNPRACFWILQKLRDNFLDSFSQEQRVSIACSNNHSLRVKILCDYFSSPETPISLSSLISEWNEIEKKTKPFQWIDIKNKDQVYWFYMHIRRKINSNNYDFTAITDLVHMELSELYYIAHYIFDDWSSSQESKELLQIKMKKNWEQKKYRGKVKGKKVLNIYLESKVKDELKKLAKENNKTITDFVENLIQKEVKLVNERKRREENIKKMNKNRRPLLGKDASFSPPEGLFNLPKKYR